MLYRALCRRATLTSFAEEEQCAGRAAIVRNDLIIQAYNDFMSVKNQAGTSVLAQIMTMSHDQADRLHEQLICKGLQARPSAMSIVHDRQMSKSDSASRMRSFLYRVHGRADQSRNTEFQRRCRIDLIQQSIRMCRTRICRSAVPYPKSDGR